MGSLFFAKMSELNILYLKQTLFEAKAYTTLGVNDILSLRNEISKLATKFLFSIESYRKSVRKILNLKNKIPIYFNKKLFLFYIKAENDTLYYINYFEVFKFCVDKNMIIIFKNGDILEVEVSKKVINSEIKKVKLILNYIENFL